MNNNFFTILKESTCELTEKKSRFIANVFHIKSEEEAKQILEKVRKTYRDARHTAYAYRLENGIERYSDDGEPSGTAGVPIFDLLRGENLANVLVTVTRYFGGILLGTGGLVKCYGGTAKQVLDNSTKKLMKLCTEFEVSANYEIYNKVLYYLKNNETNIVDVIFSDKVKVIILVEDSYVNKFMQDLKEITNNLCTICEIKKYYH